MSSAAAAQVPDGLIGKVLAGRYRIESRLGGGSMGSVYRARHIKVGRAFAVKVLHPHLLGDDKTRRRFAREAELAGSLQHANVVGVVDVGEMADGQRYLVMEFADGPTLFELIAKGAPMPGARVLSIAQQLCDGLQHAHEHGLIHRDFKSENVIVERDRLGGDTPKIVDFGVAILRDNAASSGDDRLTTAGLVLGTPHYMAPEHATNAAIDHRIDLFALGVMCFEMLTGRMPYDGDGVTVARANMMLDTPAMKDRAPTVTVDPLLEAFTRKLMMKSRDARPATAQAARSLLDLIQHDRPQAADALGVVLDEAPHNAQSYDDTIPIATMADPSDAMPERLSDGTAAILRDLSVITETTRPVTPPLSSRAKITLAAIAGVVVLATTVIALRPQATPRAPAATVSAATDAAPTAAASRPVAPARDRVAPTAPAAAAPHAGGPSAPSTAPTAPSTAVTAPTVASPSAPVSPTAAAPAASPSIAATPGSAASPTPRVAAPAARTNAETSPGHPTAAAPASAPIRRAATVLPAHAPTAVAAAPKPAAAAATGTAAGAAAPTGTAAPTGAAARTAAPAPAPPPAQPTGPATASILATRYATVGQHLKALEQSHGASATADLWPSFLRIRINDVIGDPAKRENTDALLRQLDSQIVARSQ